MVVARLKKLWSLEVRFSDSIMVKFEFSEILAMCPYIRKGWEGQENLSCDLPLLPFRRWGRQIKFYRDHIKIPLICSVITF